MLEATPGEIRCAVEVGGAVASHQGLNLPGTEVPLPSASRDDLDWVDFAVEQGIDLLAVSFVRRAEDLEPVERRVRAGGADIPLIAKIEKPQAAENAEAIIRAALSGIMVARGDLGIEMPIEQVPTVQRQLLALAGRHSRPVDHRDPDARVDGRLAATDARRGLRRRDAIFQGTDAVMLSEETAVGEYPVEAVRVMDRIARETEPELPYGDWVFNRVAADQSDVAGSVARAAVGSTYTLGLAAMVVPTRSGRTARLVSAHRPTGAGAGRLAAPRDGAPAEAPVRRQVRPRRGLDEPSRPCSTTARDWPRSTGVARSGDLIGITAGLPEQELGTNLFEVHRVP